MRHRLSAVLPDEWGKWGNRRKSGECGRATSPRPRLPDGSRLFPCLPSVRLDFPTFLYAPAALPHRMDEPTVGVVFGNVSTTEFRFAVRDPTLKRLDYVQVEHPTDGALVAHVMEVTRETNLSFEDATRMGYHDPSQT